MRIYVIGAMIGVMGLVAANQVRAEGQRDLMSGFGENWLRPNVERKTLSGPVLIEVHRAGRSARITIFAHKHESTVVTR